MGPYSFPKKIAHTDGNTIFTGWSQNSKGAGKISPLCPRKDACFLGRLIRHWRISLMPP